MLVPSWLPLLSVDEHQYGVQAEEARGAAEAETAALQAEMQAEEARLNELYDPPIEQFESFLQVPRLPSTRGRLTRRGPRLLPGGGGARRPAPRGQEWDARSVI
jgi:hypothetical protein